MLIPYNRNSCSLLPLIRTKVIKQCERGNGHIVDDKIFPAGDLVKRQSDPVRNGIVVVRKKHSSPRTWYTIRPVRNTMICISNIRRWPNWQKKKDRCPQATSILCSDKQHCTLCWSFVCMCGNTGNVAQVYTSVGSAAFSKRTRADEALYRSPASVHPTRMLCSGLCDNEVRSVISSALPIIAMPSEAISEDHRSLICHRKSPRSRPTGCAAREDWWNRNTFEKHVDSSPTAFNKEWHTFACFDSCIDRENAL
jgi:hypothetical protein